MKSDSNKSRPNKSVEEHFKDFRKYEKACDEGDRNACIEKRKIKDSYDPDASAERIDSSRPIQLLQQFESKCANRDQSGFFALHTQKIQKIFQKESEARRLQIFQMYCGMVGELMAKFPNGNPAVATYFTKDSEERRGGTTLCIVPGTTPAAKGVCNIQFDVEYEDGQLKKNEL